MKKSIFAALLFSATLYAEPTAPAAVDASDTAKTSNWQNWVFAGSAALTVTAGILLVSLNTGSHAH